MSVFWEDNEKKYLKRDLLAGFAEQKAKEVKQEGGRNTNKSTQIRKFFDEIIMYKTQYLMAGNKKEFFKQHLPYIKMINAKLAYANARNTEGGDPLIGNGCRKLFTDMINEIQDEKDFLAFADFFEAFIAYYKYCEEAAKNNNTRNKNYGRR